MHEYDPQHEWNEHVLGNRNGKLLKNSIDEDLCDGQAEDLLIFNITDALDQSQQIDLVVIVGPKYPADRVNGSFCLYCLHVAFCLVRAEQWVDKLGLCAVFSLWWLNG